MARSKGFIPEVGKRVDEQLPPHRVIGSAEIVVGGRGRKSENVLVRSESDRFHVVPVFPPGDDHENEEE